MSRTLEFLLEKYGPTLDSDELGEVLNRRPATVKAALSIRVEEWAKVLHARRVKVGRKFYYPTEAVADLLAGNLLSQPVPGPANLAAKNSIKPEESDDA
ncbi:hypothetical protein KUG47_09580 [Falsochrobactrum sp. TDYN1]|uniref:DNA-binding protein n=1 Tax=Falsochrobactrum tianjinense TaxID=2706015 RepID=A0A949PN14_9HYPH|nr:hypothetical protein [Falsochrobactrum sp. TDYN1]MBV2143748.1 hypothetical protein [Falsochrobactrum sp. TDYN1]